MDTEGSEVVHGLLLHHAGEPKGGYYNHPDALEDQLQEILADSTRRARKTGPDSSRPWRRCLIFPLSHFYFFPFSS